MADPSSILDSLDMSSDEDVFEDARERAPSFDDGDLDSILDDLTEEDSKNVAGKDAARNQQGVESHAATAALVDPLDLDDLADDMMDEISASSAPSSSSTAPGPSTNLSAAGVSSPAKKLRSDENKSFTSSSSSSSSSSISSKQTAPAPNPFANLMSTMGPAMAGLMGGGTNRGMGTQRQIAGDWRSVLRSQTSFSQQEKEDWERAIAQDISTQKQTLQKGGIKPLSRVYQRGKAQESTQDNGEKANEQGPKPSKLSSKNLLSQLVKASINSSKCTPKVSESQLLDRMEEAGIVKLYEKEVAKAIKAKVETDSDYDRERFCYIHRLITSR